MLSQRWNVAAFWDMIPHSLADN